MTSALPNRKSNTDENDPIVKLVNRILLKAIADRATDLYVQPQSQFVQIKVRQDGRFQTGWPNLPQQTIQPIIDYFTSAANIDRSLCAPQIGIFSLNTKVGKVEIGVTTLPTQFGDSIHAKLSYNQQPPPALATLISDRDSLNTIKQLIQHDRGLILIAGEKDTGKSTTVYSALAELNRFDLAICSVDNQVKYTIPGITQIGIDRHSLGRRSRLQVIQACLAQNPDVIFVGEIDSLEIAQMAIAAVHQGCLVWATIEARDVGTAIERFIALGASPTEVYTVTVAAIAQKLVPQICAHCRLDYVPPIEELGQLGMSALLTHQKIDYYRPQRLNLQEIESAKVAGKLCSHCHGMGYRGRIGLYEILPIIEQIKSAILGGNESVTQMTMGDKINIAAQEMGMRSHLDFAVNLLRAGNIDLLTTKGCVPPKTLLHNQWKASGRIESGNLLDHDLSLDQAAAVVYWQQEVTETKAEHERLLGELEKYQREVQNFEQRLKQSRTQIEQSTRAEIALHLLSVVDVIELARNSIKPQTDREAAIQKGYVMLENKILTSFREIGIHTIDAKGRRFESHLHEIVREEVNEQYPAGTIIEEFKRGYTIGDRVLRLAQVKVAIASSFL
jgi:type IV pilus assembly protein PilB